MFASLFCLGCPHPPAGINHQILPEHFLCAKHRGLWGVRVMSLSSGHALVSLQSSWREQTRMKVKVQVLATQSCLTLLPTRLLCPWASPGKNTGVGCHFLLLGIFLTQGSNPGFLHCRKILYHLRHWGSSRKNDSVTKPALAEIRYKIRKQKWREQRNYSHLCSHV